MFEVNVRNEIGKGYEALSNYSRCMNMNSISQHGHNKINDKIHSTYKTAAQNCMKNVARDKKFKSNNF